MEASVGRRVSGLRVNALVGGSVAPPFTEIIVGCSVSVSLGFVVGLLIVDVLVGGIFWIYTGRDCRIVRSTY